MKLYFRDPRLAAHKYAAEQMMLTLFPGQRPEYPEEGPGEGEDAAVFSLGPQTVAAQVRWQGREQLGQSPCHGSGYRELAGALKLAFYQAGTALLGRGLPWGALTGVRPVKLPARALRAGAAPEEALEELQEKYRVSPERARLAVDCAQASVEAQRSLRPNEVSLYIGIPFCPTRCAYCSFVSAGVGRALKLVEPYLDALLLEIREAGELLKGLGLSVRSFYMGGGTPTTLGADQLDRLLTACEAYLPLDGCTEYTVEAGRPDTITAERLRTLRSHGIGRVSINPQTLERHVLEAIGRMHTAGQFRQAYALAREAGFPILNTDLIAGLPQDCFDGFARSLEEVLSMGPENITVHTLALKKGSALMEQGGQLPGGDEVAEMLDWARQALITRGYIPYYLYRQKYMSGALENVGWTKPGAGSLYNIVMMEELQSVLALGAGGVTKLIDPDRGRIVRLSNPKFPQDYLRAGGKLLAQRAQALSFLEGV